MGCGVWGLEFWGEERREKEIRLLALRARRVGLVGSRPQVTREGIQGVWFRESGSRDDFRVEGLAERLGLGSAVRVRNWWWGDNRASLQLVRSQTADFHIGYFRDARADLVGGWGLGFGVWGLGYGGGGLGVRVSVLEFHVWALGLVFSGI